MSRTEPSHGCALEITNPEVEVYELHRGDELLARLYEPWSEDMFWCSYRLEPVSERASLALRDEALWTEVAFKIKTRDGLEPNPFTFSGGRTHLDFCQGQSDRIWFRSLFPPEERAVKPPRRHWPRAMLERVRGLFGIARQ